MHKADFSLVTLVRETLFNNVAHPSQRPRLREQPPPVDRELPVNLQWGAGIARIVPRLGDGNVVGKQNVFLVTKVSQTMVFRVMKILIVVGKIQTTEAAIVNHVRRVISKTVCHHVVVTMLVVIFRIVVRTHAARFKLVHKRGKRVQIASPRKRKQNTPGVVAA